MKTFRIQKTIESVRRESLEKEIKRQVKAGWKLLGEIFFNTKKGRHVKDGIIYSQTLYKDTFC